MVKTLTIPPPKPLAGDKSRDPENYLAGAWARVLQEEWGLAAVLAVLSA